jgi:16S rRNA (guanine966-N2)-methyltransferase
MVRIIAGKYGGRNLTSVKSMNVRPTSDRARESLFGILGDRLEGAEVLDLFAGIGSIGLEALSRGASKVMFVENDPQMIRAIKKNIELIKVEEQCLISHLSAIPFIKRYSGRDLHFDFIYIDPPYIYAKHEELLSGISHGGLLKEGGILVIEHSKKTVMKEKFRFIEKVREKVISESCMSFYEHRKSD